jgi:hypothetical protein
MVVDGRREKGEGHMEPVRTDGEFTRLFGHLRDQLLAAFVASFGPVAGRATAIDVLSHARRHWVTIRHRDDLVLHLYRVGHRLGRSREGPFGDDPVSRALVALSADERLPTVLSLGLGWPFDAVNEVTGTSVAALHRHHDHGLAKVAASLHSAGIRDPSGALRVWADEMLARLPEITLAEVDRHRGPHVVPISGWRRFSRAVASVAAGLVLVVILGLVGWQLIRWGDAAIARWSGPGTTIAPAPTTESPQDTIPEGTVAFTWTDHSGDLGLPAGSPIDLAVGPDGAVWVAFREPARLHVAVHDTDGWTPRDAGLDEVDRSVRWMTVSGRGVPWMAVAGEGGEDELYRFDGEQWLRLEGLTLWGSVAREGSGGQLWVAGIDDRLRPTRLEWAGDQWITTRADITLTIGGKDTPEGLETADLEQRIAIGDDGIAWYAGDAVTVRFDGRRLISVGSPGEPWVAVAPDGAVWAPTEFGVRRYDDGSWSYFDARHGLPGIPPIAGTIRFGQGWTWTQFAGPESPMGFVYDGRGWAETDEAPAGTGLVFGPIGAPRYAYTPDPIASIASADGVWYRSLHGWVPLQSGDGIGPGSVHRILSDPTGTLWLIADDRLRSVTIDQA